MAQILTSSLQVEETHTIPRQFRVDLHLPFLLSCDPGDHLVYMAQQGYQTEVIVSPAHCRNMRHRHLRWLVGKPVLSAWYVTGVRLSSVRITVLAVGHTPVFSTPYSTLPYVTLDSLREVKEGFVIPQRRKPKLKAKQNSPEVCESCVKNSALGSQVDSLSKDLPTSQLRAVVSNASFLVI